MDDLVERLRARAEFEDARVLKEVMRDGFEPVAYTGSESGRMLREAADALEAAREDAERWRHARKLLTIDDIEGAQGAYESFGRLISEDECKRAGAAIDAARKEARNV